MNKITYDESQSYVFRWNKIYTLLIGGPVLANSKDFTIYNHYSILSTLHHYWGLDILKDSLVAYPFKLNNGSYY
jgi:hypothetical protein